MISFHVPSFHFLLVAHGYLFLFAYLLGMTLGLPVPADPMLLLMGAMVGNHQYSFWASLAVALLGTLIGDSVWYHLGRLRGRSILRLLCKLSLEPDSCVRRTESAFAKRGLRGLLFVKFVPGIGLVTVSLAGVSGIGYWRFLLADAAGAALWAGTYLLLGRIFYRQIDSLVQLLGLFGRRAGLVLLAFLTCYVSLKYLQRWLFLKRLRVDRVTPKEAADLLAKEGSTAIIDLRLPAEIEREGFKIAGARIVRPDELRSRSHAIPENQQIILYCS